MKKTRLTKLGSLFLGLSMAFGVGAAISAKKVSEAKAAYTDDSPWTYTFVSGDVGTSSTTKTFNNVTWTLDAATYAGYDATKGVQIGSGGNPQKSNWTMTTPIASFGSGAKIKSISMGLSTASSGGISWTFAAGSNSDGGSTGAMTSVTQKTVTFAAPISSGDIVITLNSNSKAKAIYIKSISIDFERSTKTLSSIVISGSMTKTSYTTDDDAFDPAGLVANGYYSDSSIEDITDDVTWSFDPTTPLAETTSVNVTASLSSVSSNPYPQIVSVSVADVDTFEKFSGNLTEGDYVITHGGTVAMKAEVSSDRLGYETVTETNDSIQTSDKSIIWHLTSSGNYWNIYNDSVKKYAASTGAKNKAQLLESATDDKSLWSTSGSSSYEFINKQNTANSVNANLRYNSGFGFATYATSTGEALTLFKKITTEPKISVNVTGKTALNVGETASLTVEKLNGATGTVSWTTSNSDIVSISSQIGNSITVTAVGKGTASITASLSGCESISTEFTIYNNSLSTPYSVTEAIAAIDSGVGITDVYTKGVVCKIDKFDSTYKSLTYWISDNGANADALEIYSGKNIGGADFSSISDISLGDIVIVKGTMKKFNSTYEYDKSNEIVSKISINSICVKTAPSKVTYEEGEMFEPAGLVITASYNDSPSTTFDYAYSNLSSCFSFNPTITTALTSSDTSIEITLFGKTTNQEITINARQIISVTVVGDMTNKIYVKDTDWDYSGLSLSINYNKGESSLIELTTLNAGTDFSVSKNNADGTDTLTISGSYLGTSITSKTITGITYVSEVTFTANVDKGTNGNSGNADLMSKYGIKVEGSNLATTTATYRIYKGCVLTISSTGENIRKIEFVGANDADYPASNIILSDDQNGIYENLVWLGDSNTVVFTTTAQARVNSINVITESGFQELHVSGLLVNGEEATIGQEFNIEVVKNETYTLDVEVMPQDTVDTKTINYSVTSGSGVTVSEAGVLTAGAAGSIATIKAESAADSTYFVLFNVTVIDSKTVYNCSFANDATGDSNSAITTSTWANNIAGDTPQLVLSNISRVYPSSGTLLKFGGSSNGGSLTLSTPNSSNIERVILHAKYYGSDSTAAIKVNSSTAQSLTDEFKYYVFDLATSSNSITIASSADSKCRFYIDSIYFIAESDKAAVGAYGFAAELMNKLDEECGNLQVTTSTWATLSSNWNTMATNYTNSSTYMSEKTANQNGDLIEMALSRYDYIVGKYNKSLGLTDYNDFMNRNPLPIGSAKLFDFFYNENSNSTWIIVVVAIAGLTAITGCLFYRKRRMHR